MIFSSSYPKIIVSVYVFFFLSVNIQCGCQTMYLHRNYYWKGERLRDELIVCMKTGLNQGEGESCCAGTDTDK